MLWVCFVSRQMVDYGVYKWQQYVQVCLLTLHSSCPRATLHTPTRQQLDLSAGTMALRLNNTRASPRICKVSALVNDKCAQLSYRTSAHGVSCSVVMQVCGGRATGGSAAAGEPLPDAPCGLQHSGALQDACGHS